MLAEIEKAAAAPEQKQQFMLFLGALMALADTNLPLRLADPDSPQPLIGRGWRTMILRSNSPAELVDYLRRLRALRDKLSCSAGTVLSPSALLEKNLATA